MADMIIWLAYLIIAVIVVVWLRPRHDRSLRHFFWLFAGFIIACGQTHLSSTILWFVPAYWLHAVTTWLCAIISAVTATMLIPAAPRISRIPSARVAYDKIVQLTADIRELKQNLVSIAEKDPTRAEELVSELRKKLSLDRKPEED